MWGRLTWIEWDIVKLEDKERLIPSDKRKIKRKKEQAKEHDCDFEQRYVDILNFIEAEDKAVLNSKKPSLMST